MSERNRGIHAGKHPYFVEDCFGCRLATVSVAASATPSRGGGARAKEINETEKRWSVDHAAYRRLVKDGVQLDGLDGAAEVEKRAS